MCKFINSQLLLNQVKSVETVAQFVSQLRRMGNNGDAVWHFDRALLVKD
jgi:ferritin heavy chain